MQKTQTLWNAAFGVIAFGGLIGLAPATVEAKGVSIRQHLAATGVDGDAAGQARVDVRDRKNGLRGRLEVRTRKLDALSSFDVTVDGVRIGSFTTRRAGIGKVKFDSRERGGQLLGVDPRGKTIAIVNGEGAVVLQAAISAGSIDPNDVRCCLPDDSGPECEDRTAAECDAQGGINLGPGSCLPNPCSGPTPPGNDADIRCCLPDDSGPECEDRTPAECSAQGGINIGAGSCAPNPCGATPPPADADIRCCLPDDSGPECEDRTAAECDAQGGVNIGAGTCDPNACLPGATTTTTLPGAGAAVVRVRCERRSDRSKVSVDGNDLASGTYSARITSGANTAMSGAQGTTGDEVEFDFDSERDDIQAGATTIAADFLQGMPPQVTGQILDAGGAVVVQATVTCEIQ